MLSINVEPAKKMRRHYLIATVALAAVGLCLFLFSGNETAYENDRYPSSGAIDAADIEAADKREDIERRHSELYFSGASESDIYFLDEMCEGVTIDHVAMAYQWLLSAAESGDMQAINALIDAVPPERAELYFQGAYDSPEFEAINERYYPQALALLEKSITQGNTRGAIKMAYLLQSGVIVDKDDIKALGYYMSVAAVTGDYKWQHVVELFSKELFTYEIEQAQLFSKQVLKDWASLSAVYF